VQAIESKFANVSLTQLVGSSGSQNQKQVGSHLS